MDTEELQKKLEECEKEKNAYLDGWRRCKADFINYQKEELSRLEEVVKFGNEDLIKELLGVMDSFAAFKKSGQGLPGQGKDGATDAIQSQLENIFKKRGLEKIEVSLGNPFDPKYHETVGEMESSHPAGTIAEEVETGWSLHGKIVRATKVKISK
ncbi:MAG: nucleotide exchange factor GrpE [Patescibacteria group bacterium]